MELIFNLREQKDSSLPSLSRLLPLPLAILETRGCCYLWGFATMSSLENLLHPTPPWLGQTFPGFGGHAKALEGPGKPHRHP